MKKSDLLALAFIEGGMVMLLETSSPLIVVPILGHSVMIWATMICLSVGALALGYFLGAFLSRKERDDFFPVRMFAIISFILLTGWSLFYLQNFTGLDLGTASFTWIIVFIVLFVPLVIFGATTPVIISILNQKFSIDKSVVGRLYSTSTIGGVLFSLITGYWLIPDMGVSDTILLAIILTSILPFLVYIREKKRIFSLGMSIVIVGAIILTQTQPELTDNDDFKIEYFSESINGQLIVADFEDQGQMNRILFINRMGQTWITKKNRNSIWPYVNTTTCLSYMYPPQSRSLVLGLGGGILPGQLQGFSRHMVDAVEIDQRIIDISREYFGLNGVHVICDDARRYVKKCEQSYDFIVLDIFSGEILPSHVLSKEAFEDIRRILRPNGLIAINFNGFLEGNEGLAGRSLMKTLEAAGFQFSIVDANMGKSPVADRNLLYLAYLKKPDWSRAGSVTFGEEEYFIKDELVEPYTIDYRDGIVITDDSPVMEHLNRFAADKWRDSYLKNFTRTFKKEHELPFVQ